MAAIALACPRAAAAQQQADPPQLRAGTLTGSLKLDGLLDEAAWAAAPAIDTLTMSEPNPGGEAVRDDDRAGHRRRARARHRHRLQRS